jgi:hypothetical protein
MKYDDDTYYSINPLGDELGIWVDRNSEDEYRYYIMTQSEEGGKLQYLKVDSTPDGMCVACSLDELINLRDLIDEVINDAH